MAADDLKDIVLNFPEKHSVDVTRRIVAAYRAEFPDIYEKWQDIELHPGERGEDPLRGISAHVFKFLMDRCTVQNNHGAISMFAEMRRVIGGRKTRG